MDSEDFGGLLGGDITHLKPLKSTKISLVDLGIDKRFDELFIYLVLRPVSPNRTRRFFIDQTYRLYPVRLNRHDAS